MISVVFAVTILLYINNNNRHPSVRLTMDSILIVCLAGAPASVAEEADAGMTVFVTETASVLCLWSV